MEALKRFGWVTDTEAEITTEGKMRRATNPEGMRRRNVTRPKRNAVSACGGLDGGFYSEPHTEVSTE